MLGGLNYCGLMDRKALNNELEAAHKAHPEPKPCGACWALDRKRSGNEFQMYRCPSCIREIRAARLNNWRGQWKILNEYLKGQPATRTGRLDADWLRLRMHHLELAAAELKKETA